MSVNGLMSAAVSGLQTAQTALTAVSNNIANVNTPGYVREVVDQSPAVAGGAGLGVTVDDIRRVTNQFLESANYQAAAQNGSASIISSLLGQAQSAFGDPSQPSSYLNQLSTVFSDFTQAATDPASSLPRSQAIDDLTGFLDATQNVAGTLASLNTQADTQITSDVTQINQLLSQINGINAEIERTTADGANVGGSQDNQAQLLGQLSSLISIHVTTQANGTVEVRSATGQLLVGDGDAATLAYTPSVSGLGSVQITPAAAPITNTFTAGDGELQGLLSLRNNTIPGVQTQLAAYVSSALAAINAAHNANTAVPPPQTLSGRNTGLDLPTIVGDFTGKTNIAIIGAGGTLSQQVTIDFSAGTISVNGGPGAAFTPANFLAQLNGALGGAGTASFANGALTLSATAAGAGVAIQDDATTPSRDGGQGFSQFFGLNDLLTSNQISNYNTGLKLTDANGFTPGGTISFAIGDASGTPVSDITVTVPPAGSPSVQDLLNALNASIGGVGQYGSFSLDANGALTFKPVTPGFTLSVTQDTTQRGAGGPSISQLFGVGVAQQASRATSYAIRPDIVANPQDLALAQLNLAAPAGSPVVAIGDGAGAVALANVLNTATSFPSAGQLPAITTSVAQYAAILAGSLGQQSSSADAAAKAATSLQTEAKSRLQSVEGVNLDEELVNLTTYQQAYNASARLVQAGKDMLSILIGIIN